MYRRVYQLLMMHTHSYPKEPFLIYLFLSHFILYIHIHFITFKFNIVYIYDHHANRKNIYTLIYITGKSQYAI